jgi:hypothetical protein
MYIIYLFFLFRTSFPAFTIYYLLYKLFFAKSHDHTFKDYLTGQVKYEKECSLF